MEGSERRVCWIEFIRADHSTRVGPAKRSKAVRPVAAFMRALDGKLGPVFDQIVLQVHAHNQHALQRFREYGFKLNPNYNQTFEVDQNQYKLLGMSKEPQGAAVEAAAARRQNEAQAKRQQRVKNPSASENNGETQRKMPRRAAAENVNYADPEDPSITVDDLVL